MKLSAQRQINADVKEAYTDLLHCIDTHGSRKIGRLRTCNAVVYETYGYTYLESYGTKIACIGHDDNICYDFLRLVYGYTATSAQHINKFMRDYYPYSKKTYYPVQ